MGLGNKMMSTVLEQPTKRAAPEFLNGRGLIQRSTEDEDRWHLHVNKSRGAGGGVNAASTELGPPPPTSP